MTTLNISECENRQVGDHPLHSKLVDTLYSNPELIGFYSVSGAIREMELNLGLPSNPRVDLAFKCGESESVLLECKTGIAREKRDKKRDWASRKIEKRARQYMSLQNLGDCKIGVCMFDSDGNLVLRTARLYRDEFGNVDYQRVNDKGHAWVEQRFPVPEQLREEYQAKILEKEKSNF